MDDLKFLHSVNIAVHVTAGTIALLLGIVALSSKKGLRLHTETGNWFLVLLSVVVCTGLLGVFVFKRNTFLLVITLLSGYQGFSGYRVLKAKDNRPRLADIALAIVIVLSALYFTYYIRQIGLFWSPVIIYSTLGALFTVICYDFMRYLIPAASYGKMWLYEHIYKMIGAFTALLAAFAGTVFESYQPYSQVIPSALGILLQVGFLMCFFRKDTPLKA